MEELKKKLQEHDTRFDRVESKLLEHDKLFDRLMIKTITHEKDIAELKQDVKEIKVTVNKTFNKIDVFMGILKDHSVELVAHASAHRRYEDRLDRLEMS